VSITEAGNEGSDVSSWLTRQAGYFPMIITVTVLYVNESVQVVGWLYLPIFIYFSFRCSFPLFLTFLVLSAAFARKSAKISLVSSPFMKMTQIGGNASELRGLTIKFANSPPCACRGSYGQKTQYGLMTLAYQHFTDVLLLIYGSLFLSGIYYCLSVF
jgi:hypothetical protein